MQVGDKAVNKVAVNPAKYPGEHLHIDASHFRYQWEEKSIG
jgi:hypothetical protein